MSTAFSTGLTNVLPPPKIQDDEEELDQTTLLETMSKRLVAPPYTHRTGWKPSTPQDFGDGGAYPECHIAQYPLEMGRKKAKSSKTLSLTVDGSGKVKYDAIAKQGRGDNAHLIQTSYQDVLPLAKRTDVDNKEMDRPSEDQIAETTERTKAALEKIVGNKIKSSHSREIAGKPAQAQYVRYTPNEGSQRVIQIRDAVEDPLEPPRFKHKKVPRGPPSPPPPILRSPPRKATAAEQKEWMIPPCISNWKNNKGYTIPLDKRLAADGRGLQDVQINDNFAKFSEALFIGERHARDEVRQRNVMQQRLAEKEKLSKEENLRQLAQKAREERSGGTSSGQRAAMPNLAAYGSDSDASESESESESESDQGVEERERMRREKRNEREREMRISHMGHEQRAKQLAREQNRDISEKVALGLAKPTLSKEAMFDSRLYNQEKLGTSFGDDESYNLYDKPLFHGSSAAAAIYKHRNQDGDDELVGGGTEEGVDNALKNDRFNLGANATKGFEGAELQEAREGPVEFEKDVDPFGVDQFLNEAIQGNNTSKRGLDEAPADSRKRQKARDDDL
ncbi:hypothetical protein E3Q22_03184 [Wallemia mellicola]|uniref:Pre-mRNA-processing protein 45 n=1 Tax=Wallemia mellicola TaxID=1708541 RepID=A0A4V4N0C2_9BASI|nr:hypothetical protein E3Q22_03184 [Wallemia mellicola]TIB96859.1 hypothetical protein E3Q18_02927 [Wallemia mellicola]TIC10582.1 hypothetical protein E3Q15_03007 [Wallemia mellicola]TIC28863.1 hypothetical protein E3Q10_02905 [Wallemia mellicola]TIC52753.1 hypothetical protein E3Q05_02632 [Wallemia mellicola]